MSSNLIYSQYILIYLSWCIYPHLSILIYPCILIYLSILICSYSILIHSHLFSSFWILIISSHLFLSPLISSHFLICSHLFSFVPISSDHVLSCSNLVSLVSFVLTCSHLFSSVLISPHLFSPILISSHLIYNLRFVLFNFSAWARSNGQLQSPQWPFSLGCVVPDSWPGPIPDLHRSLLDQVACQHIQTIVCRQSGHPIPN